MNEYIQKCLDQLIEDNEFNSETISNPKEKVKQYIEQLENFMMNGVISVLEAEKIVTETTEIIDDFLKGEVMKERKYFAVSIKHTIRGWKFGKPCVLWGHKRTQDNEKRCFAGYTEYPNEAELYSLEDWQQQEYPDWIKADEPVHMCVNFCKKYKNYDTVLVQYDEYLSYCKCACLPLNAPLKEKQDERMSCV